MKRLTYLQTSVNTRPTNVCYPMSPQELNDGIVNAYPILSMALCNFHSSDTNAYSGTKINFKIIMENTENNSMILMKKHSTS